MSVFERSSEIACSAEELFAWHARPGALARLTPPFEDVRNASEAPALVDGTRATMEMRAGPIWTKWTAHTQDVRRGRGFVDVQERGPFAAWRHEHIFEPIDGSRCTLTDRIHYELPVAALGRALAAGLIERRLERGFAFRHTTTKLDFEQAHDLQMLAPDSQALVVAITGASGLVGRELTTLLRVSGHEVRPLVRSRSTASTANDSSNASKEGTKAICWDPTTGALDAAAAEGVDVVVHLAGEPIAEGRLDEQHRARILESRVTATRELVNALARLARPPRAFISASAVGYYGDRGELVLDDAVPASATRGDGFLADVCVAWEDATRASEAHGMRSSSLRLGVVLSPAGGALAKMMTPFAAGLGAKLGDGTQWTPYVSIDDVAGMFLRAIVDERVRGPLNAVGPEPLQNRAFTQLLGRVLLRPAIARVPRFAARVMFGALADEALFASQRAVPGLLASYGHRFRHASTEGALRHVLGRGQQQASSPSAD